MIPILILGFIRADQLQLCVDSVVGQEHGPIYISCDTAPEKYRSEGLEVRYLIESLVSSGIVTEARFSTENRGILRGVTEGISWFFSKVELGIILEDDLIAAPGLFSSIEITAAYLKNPDIIALGLHNSVPMKSVTSPHSFVRASKFTISWGWVTTAEKWNSRIKSYSEVKYFKLFLLMLTDVGFSSSLYHLIKYRNRLRLEKQDISRCTWADLWQINCFMKKKKVITYNRNLISNIGYGRLATNTKGEITNYPIEKVQIGDLDSIIISPEMNIDYRADKYFSRNRKVSTIVREKMRIRGRIQEFSRHLKLNSQNFDHPRNFLT